MVIGRGGFGRVWMARHLKSEEKNAIKEMSKLKLVNKNHKEKFSQISYE